MMRIAVTVVLSAALLGATGCGSGVASTPLPQPQPQPQPSPQPSGGISITSIMPASAVAGSLDLTVTIAGSNLEPPVIR